MLPTPPDSPQFSGLCSPDPRLGQTLAGQIQLTSVLGIGAYGIVYKARDLQSKVEYAVKALDKAGLDPRQKLFQDREIKLHYQASQHSNVVSMVRILDSPDCTYVVLEYCPEGDLFAKITEEGHYTGDDYKAKCVFLQLLDAVRHCHSSGIYHRDLKPENVLVKDNGWTVKLADFGLATQDRVTADFGCGSTFYMSPECQQSNPRPNACYASAPNDVWSLGVILVNLTCGRNPWKRAAMDDPTFKAFQRDRNFLRTILPISDELNFILQRIFEVDPRRRVSMTELRDLIVCCSSFTTGSTGPSLPPTPPYSPAQDAMELLFEASDILDVPLMEPLPGLQYPLPSTVVPTALRPYQQPFGNLPTPPGSNNCSPQLLPHTYAAKVAAPAICSPPFIAQAGYMPSFPVWSRCGQFVPHFNMPRSTCFWNSMPVY
ncbi:Serine/threonine protein kinase [Friedmanniomyces endolithicus]|nr:Serine/threonine protein kinase [Friedmanniomyces endolithicus]